MKQVNILSKGAVKIWELKEYRTPASRIVSGRLHVEGRTRKDALALLAKLAKQDGAAGRMARDFAEGKTRVVAVRYPYQTAYAAQDGNWRGWGEEAWKTTPPAAYGKKWDV